MRRAHLTNSFTKGVIDPALFERIDLAHYHNALADGLNIEFTPQGAFRRRAGTSLLSDYDIMAAGFKRRLRRRIQPVDLAAGMITAHNGGTAANLVDQNPATLYTTAAVGAATFVIAEFDLGSAKEITFVDVLGFKCASGSRDSRLAVEYWTGSVWQAVRGSIEADTSSRKGIRTTERSRRFGEWPGGFHGAVTSARMWRIVLYDCVGAGEISVQGVRMWTEKRAISPVRIFSFARTADLVYEMVLTERNIDVFRNQRYVASIGVDIDARQVMEVSVEQSLDTMLMFHEDIETIVITRQGSNGEWNFTSATFTNVPALSAGTAFSGNQDEVQELYFPNIVAGETLRLLIGGYATALITYSTPAALAASCASALNGLGGAIIAPTCTVAAGAIVGVRLTFSGTAGARRWPVIAAVMTGDPDIEPYTVLLQRGLDAAGPLFGATTGYPRCGAIYQSRLILGGMRGAPQTVAFSRFGSVFDFQTTAIPLTADLAFAITLDTDNVETIHEIFIGKNLQIFTEAGEWYVETRTLDATQPVNVLLATRYGMKATVPVTFADGATLFVQRGGRVLRDLVYSDVELSYRAEALSLLAPHLLTDVIDVGYRTARSTDEGNQLYLINADGSLVMLSLLRSQEVIAMAPWKTDGVYRAVAGDILARVWLVTERSTLTDGADLYLEKLDGTHTLDGASTWDQGGASTALIPGLSHLEGKEVWAWADGDLVGPLVVTSGYVQLPKAASRATIGLFPKLRAQLPKLREKLQNAQPFRPPARIYQLELALAGTGQIDVAVNGGPFRDVPLTYLDGVALDIGYDLPRDTSGIAESSGQEQLEALIHAVTMIPGSGDYVYSTDNVASTDTDGTVQLNTHEPSGAPDFLVSLGQAKASLPLLKKISLFASWFGSDLRAGSCTVVPKVAVNPGSTTYTHPWTVAGLIRSTAPLVSLDDGSPAFGGTPSDPTIIQAIQAMKAQGVQVTFTPFMMMDIPDGNALPNPYGGASQPAYPWRGRMTCSPAPGVVGTPDLTATAATQIAAFVGTVVPAHFSISPGSVSYSGPSEWSYRRMVLHYAALCKAAGGVSAFVIGSEMRGLTWVRSAAGVYPFVTALRDLAADVKAILGSGTKVTYAADWSEYNGHQTGVPGEIYFHLDPLWSSASIDAIGIDNYWPLSDWRDGASHLDFLAGGRSVYNQSYLRQNIFGGEGYDWYYASPLDRTNQIRTPITDGAYGKPWVWRYKDVRNWWRNKHYDRPAGVESVTPTSWVPQSKPIWFMEVGCPAVDKGANQPNVFVDPKSSESFYPYFSNQARDDAMQRAYLEALLGFFDPGQLSFDERNNPMSTIYGGRMVDHTSSYVYTWDARYYPAFPLLTGVWSDGALWATNHWITGRVFQINAGIDDAVPVGFGPELPMRDRLITGNILVENLRGWSRHPYIEISQSKPAPLEVRAIRSEVAHHG